MEKIFAIQNHIGKFLYKPKNSQYAFLISKQNKKPICNHKIDFKTFETYIEHKHPNHNACPLCMVESNPSKEKISNLNFTFEKAGLFFQIGPNGPTIKRFRTEKQDEEEEEEEEQITPTQPVPFREPEKKEEEEQITSTQPVRPQQTLSQESTQSPDVSLDIDSLPLLSDVEQEQEQEGEILEEGQASPSIQWYGSSHEERTSSEIAPSQHIRHVSPDEISQSSVIEEDNPNESPIRPFWKRRKVHIMVNKIPVLVDDPIYRRMETDFESILLNTPKTKEELRALQLRIFRFDNDETLYFFNYLLFCIAFKKKDYAELRKSSQLLWNAPDAFEIFIFDDIVEIRYDMFATYMGFLGVKSIAKNVKEFIHIVYWFSRTRQDIRQNAHILKYRMNPDLSTALIECTIKGSYTDTLFSVLAEKNWTSQFSNFPLHKGDEYRPEYGFPEYINEYFNEKNVIEGYNPLSAAILSQNLKLFKYLIDSGNLYAHKNEGRVTDNLMNLIVEQVDLDPKLYFKMGEMLAKTLHFKFSFRDWAKMPATSYNPLRMAEMAIQKAEIEENRKIEEAFRIFSVTWETPEKIKEEIVMGVRKEKDKEKRIYYDFFSLIMKYSDMRTITNTVQFLLKN